MKKQVQKEKYEFNKTDQVDRSGSAIGVLYSEAVCAESETDYVHKLAIAQKECNETIYWIKVLFRCDYVTHEVYSFLMTDAEELMRVITAIILSLKRKNSPISNIRHQT
ncbi:MAG: four helix bundle protein [Bacteroidia bacterium]|nr:four helix bundle protein [Bacteroidia bacterium]